MFSSLAKNTYFFHIHSQVESQNTASLARLSFKLRKLQKWFVFAITHHKLGFFSYNITLSKFRHHELFAQTSPNWLPDWWHFMGKKTKMLLCLLNRHNKKAAINAISKKFKETSSLAFVKTNLAYQIASSCYINKMSSLLPYKQNISEIPWRDSKELITRGYKNYTCLF